MVIVMHQIYLEPVQEEEFEKQLATERDAKIWRRLQAIYSRNQRIASAVIAQNLSVNVATITEWVRIYLKGGIKALTNLNYDHQGPKSKLAAYEQEIDKLTDDEQIPTMTCLQQRIKELYGVEVEESWLFRWCKKKSICLSKRPD